MLDTGLTIDSATGEVTLVSNPDANAQPEYSFTVSATDPVGNVVEQKVNLLVTSDIVTLDPMNDYDIGDVVYAVSDADNAAETISYSLYGSDDSVFAIDSETGEVRFNNADYDPASGYSFAVIATDSATDLSHTTLVILAVDELSLIHI